MVTLRVLEFLYLGSELSDKIVLFATRPSVESLELLSGVEKLFAESFYLFLGAMVYFWALFVDQGSQRLDLDHELFDFDELNALLHVYHLNFLESDQVSELDDLFAELEDCVHVGSLGVLATGTGYKCAVQTLGQQVVFDFELLVGHAELTFELSVFVKRAIEGKFWGQLAVI